MLGQLNLKGKDRVETAIQRIKMFEPPDGYYLAFSGGKDSVVIKALADMAGVKYDAHYNVTSVDPPELIYFIKKNHPNVIWEFPTYSDGTRATMWNLIPKKKMPPTRIVRYCCKVLKEGGGKGRFTMTGVRWAESVKRKNNRAGFEIQGRKSPKVIGDPDNPDDAKMARSCPIQGKRVLNPIIDWGNEDVWEFIHEYNISYCELYDRGYERLGCIGCPISSYAAQELDSYPGFKRLYIRAFEKMLAAREDAGLEGKWKTGEDVMKWWLSK